MTKEEVVKWLESLKMEIGKAENCTLWHYAESIDMAIKALKAKTDGDLIGRSDAIDAVLELNTDGRVSWKDAVIDMLDALPSAEARPTVIRSRTLLPTKDFKEWAKRIREVNPNAVVIPCDAEVASAEARPTGEWIFNTSTSNGKSWNVCSECGESMFHPANFCPNCGARMTPYKGGDSK